MLNENYTNIITHNNLNQPSAPPAGHRVVEPELFLCCSTLASSAPVIVPPLRAHSAGS